MAAVSLAEDLKHDREVALEVLEAELAAVRGAAGTGQPRPMWVNHWSSDLRARMH